MLNLRDISYLHPDKELLFDHINLILSSRDKISIIGNNGSGKSTLLKIIAGLLQPSNGTVTCAAKPYYIPQILGQYDHLTIAAALHVANKVTALRGILTGDHATEENFTLLDDDWTIEERCQEAFHHWQLHNIDLLQKMSSLSGGQKTKVFLAGIMIHEPQLILLDEPSNHLDIEGRDKLYGFIQSTSAALIIVSHDRKLLNLVDTTVELDKRGLTTYGGNYQFYADQKTIETEGLIQDIHDVEKALRQAKIKEREVNERQQKLDARGKAKQEKAGVARIMMNTLRNNAENSTSKTKDIHADKISKLNEDQQTLRLGLPDIDKIKFGLSNSLLHRGKILLTAININFNYGKEPIWKEGLNLQITNGERIALYGPNGSGKTTLIKILLGNLAPGSGIIDRAHCKSIYIDQDYSLIDNGMTVYQQAQRFNDSLLQEHEIKIKLNRFLFSKESWDRNCGVLSGGERMRLTLCCLTINNQSPDLIILDEPTNNIDLQNVNILSAAIKGYNGTLIVVSHDESFLKEIAIHRTIHL